MLDSKLGFSGNVEELNTILKEAGIGEAPAAAIEDAVEGTEIATINAILAVLRANKVIAAE